MKKTHVIVVRVDDSTYKALKDYSFIMYSKPNVSRLIRFFIKFGLTVTPKKD